MNDEKCPKCGAWLGIQWMTDEAYYLKCFDCGYQTKTSMKVKK